MDLAPIILFVYNRLWHTQQTVEALLKCELAKESDLYIFADGPKEDASDETQQKIAEVRQYIHTINSFKSIQIQESPTNKGLANSVIQGVSKIIDKHGKVIVVEDDIVAHPFFLRFMNDALDSYQDNSKIFAISATMEKFQIPTNYKKDVFLTYRFGSWGWATWAEQWHSVNWNIDKYSIIKYPSSKRIKQFCKGGEDLWPMLLSQKNGEIDSWAIRMSYSMNVQNRLCLRPVRSFVNNIGMDGSGIHCGDNTVSLLSLYDKKDYSMFFPLDISIHNAITKEIHSIFRSKKLPEHSVIKRTKKKIKRVLKKLHF